MTINVTAFIPHFETDKKARVIYQTRTCLSGGGYTEWQEDRE